MPVDWSALREEPSPVADDSERIPAGPNISGRYSGPAKPGALGQPATDSLMADPAFAAAVKEHAGKLRALEHQAQGGDPNDFMGHAGMAFKNSKDAVEDILTDVKGSFLSARNSTELVDLRAKQVLGLASKSESARADYLSARRRPWVSPNSVDGFFKEVPGAVAGMLGQMAGDDSVGASILAGAALGTLVKPGQGTLAGAGAGFLSGSAYIMGKTAMGEFYDRMLRVRTSDNKPLDPDTARGAALVLGALNGALGVLPLGAALGKTGLGSVLLGPGAARWLASAAGLPAGAEVLARIATQFAAGTGSQAVIGGLQELNSIMAEHAVMLDTDPKAYGQDWQESHPDELGRVRAAAKGGAQIGVGVGGIEAMIHRSGEPVALADNLGEVSNRVFQEDRAKAKVWGDKIQMEHGSADMTLPRDKLEKLFQEIGLEGDDLKSAMPEVHARMEATQGDAKAQIPVSMGDLAGYITPTKQWQQLRGDLRDGAGNLTLNELRGLSKEIKTDQEALKPGAGVPPEIKAIYDDIYAQLKNTKAMAPAAERAATIYASTVNAIAEATGSKPADIHAKMGLKFVEQSEASLDERAAGVPGATVKDAGKYRILELDKPVPKELQAYLKELREATEDLPIDNPFKLGELFQRLVKTTGSPTDAARVLAGMGWDGVDTGKTKIVWRPDASLPRHDPFVRTLGRTEFKAGETTVSFSEHADVGTVAHELGHVFLKLWHDNITPESHMAGSFEKLRHWLGATDESGSLTPEAHEKFADAFTDYLRDGVAPSVALRPVFDSYKAWLTMLYGTEKALGAPMSPEMRQVFDKLVASRKAIDYAKRNIGEPLFQTKPGVMTDAQFEKYKRDLSNLAATAQSDMEREIFSHMSQEGIDSFEKQKAAIRKQLIATDNTHSLVSFLKTGERLDSGPVPLSDTEGGPHKLDTDSLKAMGLGLDALRQLQDYHEPGGLDPALVARVFGRDDAHELVSALKSYVPLDRAAATAAATQMPGWVDPVSWLRSRAVVKFAGEVVPKMLWAEFRAMGGKLGEDGVGNYSLVRTMVENQMRRAKVSSLDPEHYLQEFHRLSDEVLKAQRDEMASGLDFKKADLELRKPADKNATTQEDKPLAELLADKHGGPPQEWQARLDKKESGDEMLSPAELQRRRMVAFESWKAARQAREDASKVNALLDKMRNDIDTRKSLADNFGDEHVKALDSAAEAYGFFQPEQPTDLPIAKYVKEQVKKGADIVEDPELRERAASRTPVGQLTVNQLRHAQDFLESLWHYVTKDLGRFDSGTGPKPLEPLVARFTKLIRDNFAEAKTKDPSRLRGMIASSTTPEHIIRLLDADLHGDIARTVIDPVADGQARGEGFQSEHEEAMQAAVKSINDGSLVGDSSLRVRDSESVDKITGKKIASPGRTLTKTELLSAVLNYGSPRNREALLRGYGITHEELMSAVQRDLSAKHIEFANKFWAEHDKYFPQEAETYAKRTRLTQEQVKAIPFKVEFSDGTQAAATGGYVPIKMSDKSRNMRDAQSVKAHPSDSFEVRDDMTMERQGSYGALELNLGRVLSSVSAKIHYATMAEPVAQVSKILLHPDFRKAVADTIGPEFNDQLFKWLRDKARDGAPLAPLGAWDKTYRWLLSGVSQASVGWNHLTAFKQLFFGVSQASAKVGVGNMSVAIAHTMADWKGTWEQALSESGVLRRMNDDPSWLGQLTPFDPNISVPLATKLQQIGHGKIFRTVSDVRAYMSELGMAQQSNIRQIGAVFAYEAAKLDAIKQNRPDVVAYAEAVVRQAVGGGDPASFMSEPGMARGTVMLYSHMSLIASEILSSATNLKQNWGKPELLALAGSLLGFLVIPALATSAISDDLKDMPSVKTHPDKFASTMIRWEILGHGLGRATPIFGDAIEQLFAYDKPQNRVAGGPIGQATGTVRTIAQAATSPKKHLADAIPAVMAATSILAHVPTNHIYKDMDLLEGIVSGRYGQNFHKWYDIMAHGPKKEGFK